MKKQVDYIFQKTGRIFIYFEKPVCGDDHWKKTQIQSSQKVDFSIHFFCLSRQATKSGAGKANFLIGFTCCHTIRITSGTNGSTEWKSLRVTFTNTTLAASGLTVDGWKYSSDKFFSADVASFGVACGSENIHLRVVSSVASYFKKDLKT